MAGTPIELILYDAEDAPIRTLTKSVIPWGILKRALRLANHFTNLDLSKMNEADLDELTAFIVAVFADKASMEELEKGADLGDMMNVFNQIMAKAGNLMPNPPIPGK